MDMLFALGTKETVCELRSYGIDIGAHRSLELAEGGRRPQVH